MLYRMFKVQAFADRRNLFEKKTLKRCIERCLRSCFNFFECFFEYDCCETICHRCLCFPTTFKQTVVFTSLYRLRVKCFLLKYTAKAKNYFNNNTFTYVLQSRKQMNVERNFSVYEF